MKTNKSILLIKSAIIAFVLTTLYSVIPFQAVCAEIPNNVFRFHILANSDTEEDQTLKLKVRDKVLERTKILFDTANSKSDAEEFVKANLETIEEIAQNEVYKNGYNYPVKAEIVNMHFDLLPCLFPRLPLKCRLTGTLRTTNYDLLHCRLLCEVRRTFRQAECSFRNGEYSVVTDDKVEYKFFIVELFQKIFV